MNNFNHMSDTVTRQTHERRRTVVALFSASVISLMVWALVVALHLR